MNPYRSRFISRAACATLAALVLAGTTLAAHDMWIEPTAFRPDVGTIVGLRLRVGQDFLGDPLPRTPELIDQFVTVDASGRKPIVGRDGADPAGLFRMSSAGLTIVGYRSRPSSVVLPADTFNKYLSEEGLDSIAAIRASRQESTHEAHELFARCAKSLILSGAPADGQADRSLGFTLELVAERNPYALGVGGELPVRLTYEGRPLPGALVVAINRADPSARQTTRSDADGRVRFHLPRSGAWLVKSVHMIPAPAGSGAEWASFWASLTFDLAGAAR